MAKPEWGTKRICQSCSARFYDFQRSPITCPACGAVFEIEAVQRTRRPRAAPRGAAAVAVAEEASTDGDEELETVADEAAEEGDFEDADELGEEADVDVVRPDDDDETT